MALADVFVIPDTRRKRVTARVNAPSGRVQAHIEGTNFRAEGTPGEVHVEFPDHLPWSPESPVLYTLHIELTLDNGASETARVRFGMREFSVKDNRFHLNGRPLHLKGVHHDFDYPAGADHDALMRQEITLAKEAGFALIHLHATEDVTEWLDLADEIGMMVWLEGRAGAVEAEQINHITPYRNHPSVVAWITAHPGLRAADPTRLLLLPATKALPGRLVKPFRAEVEPFDDVRLIRRAPVGPQTEDLLRACGEPDQLSFLAAFGFGGLSPAGLAIESPAAARAQEALAAGHAERDLTGMFETPDALAAAAAALQSDAVRYQFDAARANPKLAGYCWVQLCDSPGRYAAGLLDVSRAPKPAYDTVKRVHKIMRPLIQMTATNLRPRQEVPVTVLLTNEERIEGRCDISLQVVGPTNQVLWKKRRASKLPRHAKELWNGAIGASGSTGRHRFIVRVLDGLKVLAEAGQDFNVYESPAPCDVAFHVVDPRNEWAPRLANFKLESVLAPVIIVPALTNSVCGYPDEVLQALAQVKGGAVAVFFAPPGDWNDLAERLDESLLLHPCDATGGIAPALHYAKVHPLFEGAQSRCLMRQPFRYVAPQTAFLDTSDEDIASTFNTWLLEQEESPGAWASDVVVRRYGSGRVIFTHLRILESLGTDPLADRLFVNLLNHCARRSVAGTARQPAPTKASEWLRNARGTQARRWMVIGEFPNWNGAGHETAYPPETSFDAAARYPGWHGPVGWRQWHTLTADSHALDLHAALNFREPGLSHANGGTVYAYAEFTGERRQDARFTVISPHACKVWLNGALLMSCEQPADYRRTDTMAPALVKQGRNTLLIKSSQSFGPHVIEAGLSSATREPLMVNWWR
jgi:beta-galactosidase